MGAPIEKGTPSCGSFYAFPEEGSFMKGHNDVRLPKTILFFEVTSSSRSPEVATVYHLTSCHCKYGHQFETSAPSRIPLLCMRSWALPWSGTQPSPSAAWWTWMWVRTCPGPGMDLEWDKESRWVVVKYYGPFLGP